MKTNKKMLVLSAIGIIMVVSIHTSSPILFFEKIFPAYSFFMPMFIFISGYFYKIDNEDKLLGKSGYICKKIKKIIIPYFIWNLVYGLLGMILRHFNIIEFGMDINFKSFFIEPWISGHQYWFNLAGWFVLALFLTNITYVLIRKLITKLKIWNDHIAMIFFFILTYVCFYIGVRNDNLYFIPILRTGFYLFFYHFGYYYKTKIENKFKVDNFIYLLVLIFIELILLKFGKKLTVDAINLRSDTNSLIATILANINGILFWTKIAEVLEPVLSKNKYINFIGNYTYDIMMHHMFFVFLLNLLIMKAAPLIGFTKFSIADFKSDIYYFYTATIYQYKLFYTFVGIAGPLTMRYLYIKVKDAINEKRKVKIKSS